jgi:agmatine deiminase
VIWLPRGLTRDSQRFGTRGHVDIVAAIPSPGTLLVHSQQNPAHPDYEVSREIISFLSSTTDAAGPGMVDHRSPGARCPDGPEGFVDYSYINHVVVNGGVIACTLLRPQRREGTPHPGGCVSRTQIVGIDARELFARGGGIHCITQQQPAAI